MKQRSALAELNELQTDLELPKLEPDSFTKFREKLRKVIEANFDYPTACKLEFSLDDQAFWLEITYGSMLSSPIGKHDEDSRTAMTLRRVIQIDPLQPIQPQVKEAMKAAERLRDRHMLLQVLLEQHLEKE